MNCKPGDLAIVVRARDSSFLGMLVEILYAGPSVYFRLPDGHMHEPCEPGEWVFKILGAKRVAEYGHGTRLAEYGCGHDSFLKPIRGLPQTDDIDESITA